MTDKTKHEVERSVADEVVDYHHSKRLAHKIVSQYRTEWVNDDGISYQAVNSDGSYYLRD